MCNIRRFSFAVTLRAGACLGFGIAAALATAATAAAAPGAAATGGHWVAAWYSPPFPETAVWGADQCGDDLHPNDAGYQAMAEAAFQRLFTPGSSGRAPLARAVAVGSHPPG